MMRSNPSGLRRGAAMLGGAALVVCSVAWAAGPAPMLPGATPAAAPAAAPPAAAPARDVPGPVAAADIPRRADEDEAYLEAVVQRFTDGAASGRFAKALQSSAAAIQTLDQQSAAAALSALDLLRLESLRRHWLLLQRQLERSRTALTRATKAAAGDAAGLATRRAAWQETRDVQAGSAPALLQRIDQVAGALDEAELKVSAPLAELIQLGREGSDLASRIRERLGDVDAAIADQDRSLLSLDQPPIWSLEGAHGGVEPPALGLRESLAMEADFAGDYDAANGRVARVLVVVWVVLLPLMWWMRRRAAAMVGSGEATEEALYPLSHPWAAWLVLVALGFALYNVKGPTIRQEAILLLAWVPVLRLLPRQVMALIGPWAYLGALFYLFNAALSLVVGHPLVYRGLLLLVDAAMFASVAWLIARRPLAENSLTNAWAGSLTHSLAAPWVDRASQLLRVAAAAVALTAALSNVIGNVSLAAMLTNALLDSGYAALALYVGATVLAALFRVLLAGPLVSWLTTRHAGSLIHAARNLGKALVMLIWVVFALESFRLYRPLRDWLGAVLTHDFTLGTLSISLGSLFAFLAAAWLAVWLAKTVRMVLADDILPSMSVSRGVGNSISTLSYYVVLVLGMLAALAAAGYHVGQLAIVFGALGVGIGFGLQDVVKNFVAGIILMVERPIQPGDVVDVAGTFGTVREIRLRATIVVTFDGADVVVPNGMLLAGKLVNWTLSRDSRRIDVTLCTGFANDPQRTIDLLLRIAGGVEGVAPQPAPAVVLTGMPAGVLEFSVRAWTIEHADWVVVRSRLIAAMRDGMTEAGIEVPLPQRDVILRSAP